MTVCGQGEGGRVVPHTLLDHPSVHTRLEEVHSVTVAQVVERVLYM